MKPILGGCIGFFVGAWSGAYVLHMAGTYLGDPVRGIEGPGDFWWNIPLVLMVLCWTAICTGYGARRCGGNF